MADLRLPNLNVVILSGRLTQDPELRYTPSGAPVVRFRIASDRPYRDASGQWQRETLFIDVTAWRDLAERVNDRGRKGAAVIVQGYLRSRSWETQEGVKRSAVEVIARNVQFLDKAAAAGAADEFAAFDEEEPDEDLPF